MAMMGYPKGVNWCTDIRREHILLEINMNRNMNPLDLEIHNRIVAECKSNNSLTITEAAGLCHCSPSKISKFVKKLGFNSYKQYRDYLCGRKLEAKPFSDEFERIKHFLDTFDISVVDKFIDKIRPYKKIVLLGYGPSKYCAQYLQFKLQLFTSQAIILIDDERSASSVIDKETIFIIFSATGAYNSFRRFQQIAEEKKAQFLLIVEEYNTSIIPSYGEIIFLTDTFQTLSSVHYEKSRIVFFIFIEEIIAHIIKNKAV